MAEEEDRARPPDGEAVDDQLPPEDFIPFADAVELVLVARPRATAGQAEAMLVAAYRQGRIVNVRLRPDYGAGPNFADLEASPFARQASWWRRIEVVRAFPSPTQKQPTAPAADSLSLRLSSLAEKGIELITTGGANSANDAAGKLIAEARAIGAVRGRTTDDSIQNRLRRSENSRRSDRLDNPPVLSDYPINPSAPSDEGSM